MKTHASSGRTKAPSSVELAPKILGKSGGEQIFFLLQTEGRGSGKDTLQEESEAVLQHSLQEAEGEAYTRLEGVLKELNGLFKGMLVSGAVKDIHAIVGLLEKDGTLHLSHTGRAEAYLIRDGSAAQITEYSRGKPLPSFAHIASGPLEERDHVVLSTQRLLRTITPAQLAQTVIRGGDVVKDIVTTMESDKEVACIVHLSVEGSAQEQLLDDKPVTRRAAGSRRSVSRTKGGLSIPSWVQSLKLPKLPQVGVKMSGGNVLGGAREKFSSFLSDLRDPKRKRRAHLLLLAGATGVFLIFWVVVQLSLASQKSQSREELAQLVEQISTDLRTAENRQLTGDIESANAILQRAEDRARQIMANESGLFRSEALDLMDRIRLTQEEINNIVRIPPRMIVNLSAKNPDIEAQGMIPVTEGEFTVYDKQDLYRVLLNTVDDPEQLDDEELILDGAAFPRFQSRLFQMTGNSMMELINGQPTVMKTDDPAGWKSGTDIKTYLQFLYMLAPDQNQIYKYERLANRYGPPSEYNVNGDLSGGIDMTIDGAVYVLKQGGQVVKLFRGETQDFVIRNLPDNALANATKIFKSSPTGNFYFLDPTEGRIIMATGDTNLGESAYVRQYVLESEQVGTLTDLYVDEDDTRLYVLDEKRLWAIDLQSR